MNGYQPFRTAKYFFDMKYEKNRIPPERIRKSTRQKVSSVIGKKFNRLTVLSHAHNIHSHIHLNCICECGNEHITRYDRLINGTVNSCGCLTIEKAAIRMTKHGMHLSRIYCIWEGMIGRCERKLNESYHNYGGRGITVCERWHNFENFYNDTKEGYADNLTLDRFPNRNGNYEPSNFRWATTKQQSRNTNRNVYLEYNGENLILTEWAERLGFKRSVIPARISYGWPTERILTEPVFYSKGKNQFGNNKKLPQCQSQ